MYHYVYRITHKELSKHYYGCRTSAVTPKEDIGVKYFSSSKDKTFINDQKTCTYKYKYKVVKVFTSRELAIEFEILLHNKFDVGKNPKFYNKCKQTAIGFDTSGGRLSEEHIKRLTVCSTGRKLSEYAKLLISESRSADFSVYNYKDELVAEHLSSKDIISICRSLYGKTKDNRLGATYVSKQQLNKQCKLHLVGYYCINMKGVKNEKASN